MSATRRRFARVVFIEPKSTHIHVYSSVHIPRTGGLLLGTMLRDRGHEVSVVVEDMLPRRVTEADVWRQIAGADLLCVSTITPTAGRCAMWASRARAAGIPVLMGGPHVTYFPDEAMEHADWVLRGECDETLPVLMDVLEGGGDPARVPGLTWRDGGAVRHNPDARLPPASVLESNPFPDHALLWRTDARGGVLSVAVARGCPFNCSFCSVTRFNGAALRAVSPARTLDMVEEYWRRYRPHYVFFAEDIFNLVRPRAREIVAGLAERGIRPAVGFGAQVRHEASRDTELLDLMRAAHFDRVMVGFESVNQASLDLCGKRETVEEVAGAIGGFHRHGVKVHGMFVVGFDTDTPRTFADTLRFAKRHRLDSFQLMLLTPLPGTRDWDEEGYADGTRPLMTRDWAHFDGHHAVSAPRLMTAWEANTLAVQTLRRFYTLPRALARLAVGDVVECVMRLEGRRLVRRWLGTRENREYLDALRRRMMVPAAGVLAEAHRRVVIAHTAASVALKGRFDSFFADLGVSVEHSRAGLGELLCQGQARMDEARGRLGEFLADRGLLARGAGADLIVVPEDRGGDAAASEVNLGPGLPPLLRLNVNARAKVLADQWVQLASRYTADLRAAADAFRKAMGVAAADGKV